MKILALNINQGNVRRGLESFLDGLKNEMEEKGVEFCIIGSKGAQGLSGATNNKNLLRKIRRRLYLDNYSLQVLLFSISNVAAIKRYQPDILIPTNGGWQVIIARLLRRFFKFKTVIVGEAGIGFDDEFNLKHGNPDLFVALTKEQEDWGKKINPHVNIIEIPNGVDDKFFSETGEKVSLGLQKPIFLCVAAFDDYKNIDKTICAVSELNKGSLVILGDGQEKEKLSKLGNDKLGDRFLRQKVNHKDLPKWYRAANVFTLVSGHQEAFGNVYIEAMACGLPVVATDDAKRREIIGEAGMFVNPNNRDEYKTALMKAAIINWGGKPRRQAERFSWEKIGERYYQILTNTIKF